MTYQQENLEGNPEPNSSDSRAELSNTLLDALWQNNEQRALELIKKGADVNFTFRDGKTVLLHAILYQSRIVSVLIDAGADVNGTDDAGKTALMYCAEHDDTQIRMYRWMRYDKETIFQKEANVNIMDERGETSAELVTKLLKAGADVNKTDKDGRTALMYAARPVHYSYNQDEIVLKILIYAGANLSATDNKGKTALMYAIQRSKESIAHALLDAGADHSVTDNDGKSALFFTAFSGNESVVQRLIKAGADLNTTDNQGKTALMHAIQNVRVNVATKLIDAGADTNIADNEGNTALIHLAIYSDKNWISPSDMMFLRSMGNNDFFENNDNRNKKIISKLIEVNTDLNATNNEGITALIYAIQINRGTTACALLDAGADHSVIDNNGKTALMYSLQSQHNKEESLALIKAGADVNISDHEGKTALFYGLAYEDVIHALIEDGHATVNKRDRYGRSVLFYSFNESLDSTRYLLEKGGNLNVKDNCTMSIISFCIENLMAREDGFSVHFQKVNNLVGKRIQPNTIFEAIINAVFCKIFYREPLLQNTFHLRNIIEAMHSAKIYIIMAEQAATEREKIEKVIEMMKEDRYLYTNLEKVADLLVELGANPHYADADGNTALHYATCLPLVEPHETTVAMTMCQKLEDLGVSFNTKNHQCETPLLFCLSKKEWIKTSKSGSKVKTLVEVCKYLLEHGSSVEETTRSGKSVFHLMLELFQEGLRLMDKRISKEVLAETMKILELFSCSRPLTEMTVNKRDANLDSPLHLWAMLELHLSSENDSSDVEHNTLKKSLLGTIFKHLVAVGLRLDGRNNNDETPMHLCSSWIAVKLLIDAGANTKVLDSKGSSPLLVASKKYINQGFPPEFFRRFLLDTFEHEKTLYENISQEPKAFWKTVLDHNLDPWAVDNHGTSVLSILIQVGALDLAKELVEVACEENYIQSDNIAVSFLNAVCQDSSTRRQWKSILVEMILKSRKAKPISYISNEDTALHLCCRSIVKSSEDSDDEMIFYYDEADTSVKSAKTSVHWTIAKQLLTYGMDCNALDASGQSCLEIANKCPALQSLLLKPVDIDEVPLAFPWTSISTKYKPILSKVARRQECKQLDLYWYHETNIQKGSFGLVFAGMNEKDGREVAIKRIEKLRNQQLEEDKKEIKTLTALADCEQVVRYLSFAEDEHFCYVILELMEGNLNDYLDGAAFDDTKSIQLCGDVLNGLIYLHQQKILHRDLKPSNILFKTYPKLCLKIADFGLSRRIDTLGTYTTSSGSVVGTRCWIAPEVLKCSSKKTKHQMACDVFSAGLVLYYILSGKKHPFTPADCKSKSELQVSNETESNILHDRMESFRCSTLCPEAIDLVHNMLDSDQTKRPTAAMALTHPFFWPEKKKMDFLSAVGNQPEFECPRKKRKPPLSNVETELDGKLKSMIIAHPTWDDPNYAHMPTIYTEMTKKRNYDTSSVVELVRFIRNTIAHVSADKRPTLVKELVLQDFVFLEYFPNLVMEVFKCVKMHGWNSREEIKYQLS